MNLARPFSFAGCKVPAKTQGWVDGRFVDSAATKGRYTLMTSREFGGSTPLVTVTKLLILFPE